MSRKSYFRRLRLGSRAIMKPPTLRRNGNARSPRLGFGLHEGFCLRRRREEITMSEAVIHLALICRDFPNESGIRLGLQQGQDVVQEAETTPSAEILIQTTVRIKSETPRDYAGDVVHGTRGDRFLYLNWLKDDPDAPSGQTQVGRAKFHLERLNTVPAGSTVRAVLHMTTPKGQRLCARIPSMAISEWTVETP
jgi:hypothetical protein